MKTPSLLMLMFVWLFGATWAAPCFGQLPPDISRMLRESNLPDEAIGISVSRVNDGKRVLTHGADKPLQPASTMKVLTAIVGLERLGPAYRSHTELRSDAVIENGALKGNLVLRGFGNPDITWEDFQRMLQSLRHRGVNDIQGDLIVDRGFFQPGRIDVGIPPFDESPEFRYNVIPDALLINMNLAQYDIETDTVGFQIRLTPALDGVRVISNMTFDDRACAKWEDGWKIPTTVVSDDGEIRVYLNGTFPKNCSQSVAINVIDRADFTARLFRSLWRGLGGTFNGRVREVDSASSISGSPTGQPAMKLLAEHRARPLAEVARNINKVSDNTITRGLFLTLGTLATPDAMAATVTTTTTTATTTQQRADAEIRLWLKQKGIDDGGLVLDNGSGLSRAERITPAQLAAVLQAAYQSKWAPEFISSLPIVAVDGSMRNRLKSSPAAELGRIKTGSLRDVVSVAGYMPDASGQQHVVVAMINHPRAIAAGGRAILDALLDWVAKSGGPVAASVPSATSDMATKNNGKLIATTVPGRSLPVP